MPLRGNMKGACDPLSEEEASEEDEDQKKDFFESMIYWKQEQDRKKGTKMLAEAQEAKEIRKKLSSNGQANAYEF
jgi:hypothetical protein